MYFTVIITPMRHMQSHIKNPTSGNTLQELHDISFDHLIPFILMIRLDNSDYFFSSVQSFNVSTAFYVLEEENLSIIHTHPKWNRVIANKMTINNISGVARYDFQGMPVSSFTSSWYAWFQIEQCNLEGKGCKTRGILADFMDILGSMYNFTWYSDKDMKDNWGFPKVKPNGTYVKEHFSGILRSIMNRNYDLSLSNWNHFLERNELVDTSFALVSLKAALYIGESKKGLDFSLFNRPFTWKSWVVVICMSILIMALSGIWFQLKVPGPMISKRCIILVSGMYFIIVHSFYGGASTMFYATPRKIPFEGIYDALKFHPVWKLISLEGYSNMYNNMELTNEVRQLLQRMETNRESIIKQNLSEAFKVLKEPGYYLHGMTTDIEYYLQTNNVSYQDLALSQSKTEVFGSTCLILQKHSPFLPIFNDGIMKMRQTGLIQLLMRKHITAIHHKSNAVAKAMNFLQMTTLFISFVLCIITSLFLLIFEYYHYKRVRFKNIKVF